MAEITQRAKERLERLKGWLDYQDRLPWNEELRRRAWLEHIEHLIGDPVMEDVRRVAAEIAARVPPHAGRDEALGIIEAAVNDVTWHLARGPDAPEDQGDDAGRGPL